MDMRRLFLVLFSIGFSNILLGVTTYTSTTTGGNWSTGTTWVGGTPPPGSSNNANIIIDGSVTSNSSITLGNNDALTVNSNDTLVIIGDFTMNNNASISIQSGAVLLIRGNLNCNNNLNLDANSYLIVTGNLTTNNNTDISSTTTPSQVFVGGTVSTGANTTGNVINCPGGTGYNSGCNYGNMIDLLNDSISTVINQSCTPQPTFNSTPTSNSVVISGDTIFLSADPNAGTSSYTSYWTGPAGYISSSTNTAQDSIFSATTTMTGYYTLFVVNSSSCYIKDSTYVQVSNCGGAVNGGTIGSDQSICPGDTALAFTNDTSASPGSGFTYQWFSSTNSSDPSTGTWTTLSGETGLTYNPGSPDSTTYYYRQATKGAGCTSNSNVLTITLYSAPSVTISGDTTGCESNVVTLSADPGFSNYSWSQGATTLGNLQNQDVTLDSVPPPSTSFFETFSVTATDTNNCSATDAHNIHVFRVPETGPEYHINNNRY